MVDYSRPQAFTQLLNRGSQSDVVLARWCPTMDLVALVTADGQLQLHRLNWQRLWWLPPETPFTVLTWRPDGKQLAAGQSDGTVLILSAEDGEILHSEKFFDDDAVTALSWTQSADPEPDLGPVLKTGLEERARRLFEPPLPASAGLPAAAPAGYAQRLGKRDGLSWPQRPDRLNVLTCASQSGRVVACTAGLYPLLGFAVEGCALEPVAAVHAVAQKGSLRELSVCWEGRDGALHLAAFDVSCLGKHAAMLRTLGYAAADIAADVASCRAAAAAAGKEWAVGFATHRGVVDTLNQLLKDHNIDSDAMADLLLLVTMGEYSAAMEQFLQNTLGEAGLKKTARTIDAALHAVHAVLIDRLQPGLELLAFRLGELRGLALAPQGRDALHLKVSRIGAAERCAQRAMRLAERLRAQVVQVASQYRIFFAWLATALRRFPEDTVDTLMGYPLVHIDTVQEFLHTEFKNGTVGPLLDMERWGAGEFVGVQPPAEEEAVSEEDEGARSQRSSAAERDRAAADAEKDSQADLAAIMALLMRGQEEREQGRGQPLRLAESRRKARQRVVGEWAGGGMVQLLEQLDLLCSVALERTARKLSPAVKWMGGFMLGPSQPGGALAVEYQGAELAIMMGCQVAGASSALSIKVAPETWPETVRAARLDAPQGSTIADAAFYKGGGLMALVSAEEGCALALVEAEALQYSAVSMDSVRQLGSVLRALPEQLSRPPAQQQLIPALAARQRKLPHSSVQRPLAVSASRGVGFVVAAPRRMLLFDLEEDEDEVNEAGVGEGGAGDDAAMGTP